MGIDYNVFFREMTLRICGSLDIEQALAHAFAFLRAHIPADTMGLGFNDLSNARIRVVARIARPGADYLWPEGADEIALSPEMVAYIRARPTDRPMTLVVNRPGQQPAEMHQAFPGLATQSAIFQRLEIRGEEIGALLVSAAGGGRYTEEHARLLDAIREPFAIAMLNTMRYRQLETLKDRLADDNRALAADIKRAVGVEVIGADFGLRDVMARVRRVALWNSPVLLLGETGTGKEVIANAIHQASPRSSGPLISMQCGAIPEPLLDSELFGHERGAFTGAVARKRGRFERAHGGTLFLDEIGELSPEAQVKLLRVLQEHRFERIGGSETIDADVRVVAATHRDLEGMVRDGGFREDLWYRLSVVPIRIPPLRLRREDIPSLVHHFIHRKAQEMGFARVPQVSAAGLERLSRYDWPGNVRELQNIVERALILSRSDTLDFPSLTAEHVQPRATTAPADILTMDQAIAAHIHAVLEVTRWQVAGPGGAAERLEMNPSTLRFRMKKLGIVRPAR
ncbi:MAG: sigma 54-interacting transcriptional regulator [Myxococcota bacterium]